MALVVILNLRAKEINSDISKSTKEYTQRHMLLHLQVELNEKTKMSKLYIIWKMLTNWTTPIKYLEVA